LGYYRPTTVLDSLIINSISPQAAIGTVKIAMGHVDALNSGGYATASSAYTTAIKPIKVAKVVKRSTMSLLSSDTPI
jgi:hypothetical protein